MRVLGLKRALLVAVALMQEPVPELLGLLGQIQVELPEQVAAQTDRVLAMELARRTEVQGRDLPELGQL